MKLSKDQVYELLELAKEELEGARDEYRQHSYANALVVAARAYGMMEVFLMDKKNRIKRVYYELLEEQVVNMIELSRRKIGI